MAIRLNQSGLLFVPKPWQRNDVLRWLKRIHAWTGFWGALLFLMMGTSGFLLNHRATLKIDTGQPVETSRMEIAVAPGSIPDEDALGAWARRTLHLSGEGRRPGGPGQGGPGGERAGGRHRGGERSGERHSQPSGDDRPRAPDRERFLGRALPHLQPWERSFNLPSERVTVSYVPSANHVSARREDVGLLGTIKNLHKGVGLGMIWVLFLDTIAGGLVAMSVTGVLLWTRLHGTRLLAAALAGGSLTWACAAVLLRL